MMIRILFYVSFSYFEHFLSFNMNTLVTLAALIVILCLMICLCRICKAAKLKKIWEQDTDTCRRFMANGMDKGEKFFIALCRLNN